MDWKPSKSSVKRWIDLCASNNADSTSVFPKNRSASHESRLEQILLSSSNFNGLFLFGELFSVQSFSGIFLNVDCNISYFQSWVAKLCAGTAVWIVSQWLINVASYMCNSVLCFVERTAAPGQVKIDAIDEDRWKYSMNGPLFQAKSSRAVWKNSECPGQKLIRAVTQSYIRSRQSSVNHSTIVTVTS